MPTQSYVNGRYLPHVRAKVHIEDRGYQFSDGVYEVIPVCEGFLMYTREHMSRLMRSLRHLSIPPPVSSANLLLIGREVIARNRLADGCLYVQVTRGVAPRSHAFPAHVRSSLVVSVLTSRLLSEEQTLSGVRVISIPDRRWARPDIKSISLLPNVLAKQEAQAQGAFEAWLVDDSGYVTEGASSNVWIVDDREEIVTRRADRTILAGITRAVLFSVLSERGYTLRERSFSIAEACRAREVFMTSGGLGVVPVRRIDSTDIGNGRAGKISVSLWRLRGELLHSHACAQRRDARNRRLGLRTRCDAR